MSRSRLVSLAAGTVLDARPVDAIHAAARAGFGAVGIRFSGPPGAAELAEIRAACETDAIQLLDIEVIRLRPGVPAAEYVWLIEAAKSLGARFVLFVSEDSDRRATSRALRQLCRHGAHADLSIAVEFMRFTAIRTLADARDIVERAGEANAVLVVDALHLARAGGRPEDLAGLARIGFVQVCDAMLAGPTSDADLADEARHHRLLPGRGQLPLREFIAAVDPSTPVSVEIQSDHLAGSTTPEERAELAIASAATILTGGAGAAGGAPH